MASLIILLLAVALAFTALGLYVAWRRARALQASLDEGRPYLLSKPPGLFTRSWDGLIRSANRVLDENRRLKEQRSGQLAHLEATLGSLKEAVLIVDAGNAIRLANHALSRIAPRAQNTIGQKLETVLQSADFLTFVESVRIGLDPEPREFRFHQRNLDLWLEITGSRIPPLEGERGPWALFVLHDITRMKGLEQTRKEFVSNVSHEIRTPLAVIKGYVETLVDDHRTLPAEDRDLFLRTIHRHTERLHALLEDLLILSRLESSAPGLAREPVDLGPYLNSVAEDYQSRPAVASWKIQTEFSLPGGVQADLDLVKMDQVFQNLIGNSLKYTPGGSTIRIGAKVVDESIECWIADNGPGIPERDLPRIFERFYRVDKGRSRESGGTGLGLSIVKHIVQLHGGAVNAESRIGEGTLIRFTLPVRQQPVDLEIEAGKITSKAPD